MKPFQHFLFAILVSFIFLLFFPSTSLFNILFFIFSTVLIDIDHYAYFIFKKKSFNPIKAYSWYRENNRKGRSLSKYEKRQIYFGFHFLHGIEILMITYFLYYIFSYQIFLSIFLGFSFHLFIDIINEAVYCGKSDKISIVWSFLRSKKLKFIEDIEHTFSKI